MQSKESSAIAQIAAEKNIDADAVVAAIEAALAAAYRKDFGEAEQKVRVEFEADTGLIRVFRQWEVIEDKAEMENEEAEIFLKEAKKKKKDVKVGDNIEEDVTPKGDFGRIAAQTAKQVLIQHIREAEREAIYNLYKDRVGELLNAQVQRVEMSGDVFLTLEKATIALEPSQQIPQEQFYNGQRVKVYLESVDRNDKTSQVVISRTHPDMIRRLLEMEVPEIEEGTVQVKDIAREAGVRTKVSVMSTEEGVDPVGSCVGQKGVRIQAVTDELSGERIDIVQYDEDPIRYLMNALAPAKIVSVQIVEEKKLAKVYVIEEQRSLAIGKNGQNVRLASKLTKWEIDILDFNVEEEQAPEAAQEADQGVNADKDESDDSSVEPAIKSADADQATSKFDENETASDNVDTSIETEDTKIAKEEKKPKVNKTTKEEDVSESDESSKDDKVEKKETKKAAKKSKPKQYTEASSDESEAAEKKA